jgi:hypothetical protein
MILTIIKEKFLSYWQWQVHTLEILHITRQSHFVEEKVLIWSINFNSSNIRVIPVIKISSRNETILL